MFRKVSGSTLLHPELPDPGLRAPASSGTASNEGSRRFHNHRETFNKQKALGGVREIFAEVRYELYTRGDLVTSSL